MKQSTIIWVSLVFVAIVALFIWLKKCNDAKPDVIAAVDSLQYYKNKNGENIAAIKQREQDYNRAAAGYLDSIAKLHNSKQRLLQEVAVLKQKGSVVITTPGAPRIVYDTVYTDTGSYDIVPSYVDQEFRNPWYHAYVYLPLKGTDSSILDLETYDTLRYVVKTVKEGNIFNRRTYLQVDAVNDNPYNTITGLSVFRKPLPKPKKIGIGLQVGYGFSNSLKPSVFVGVGASYNIIRL